LKDFLCFDALTKMAMVDSEGSRYLVASHSEIKPCIMPSHVVKLDIAWQE
jgi:hypothetical protein